jgi:hypothetical protein
MQQRPSTRDRRRSILLTVLIGAAATTAIGASRFSPDATALERASNGKGSFVAVCAFDHRSYADPIVFPGQPRAAHSHDFFGNTTTDAFSTTDTLRVATKPGLETASYPGTSCNRAGDKSAYWVPMLTKGNTAYAARVMRVYYRAGIRDVPSIRPMPAGLRMIAGDHKATAPQSFDVAAWACSVDGDEIEVGEVPTCASDSPLRLRIIFPSCWNGVDLDSADHKSHMAYPVRSACPASHPVAVPKIVMGIRYRDVSGPGVSLSCGTAYCGHADFMNGWDQSALGRLVDGCIRSGYVCGDMEGPGGAIKVTGRKVPVTQTPAPSNMAPA